MFKKFLVIATAVAIPAGVGCASADRATDDSADFASAEIKAAGSTTKDPACQSSFFTNHPHTGTQTLSSGAVVNVPFWGCDSAFSVVFGTVDYSVAAGLAAGTGYVPVKTNVDGKDAAIIRIYVNGYSVSDAGKYREVIVAYEANQAEITYPWANAYSAAVPAFMPGNVVMLHRLYLDRKLPIDYGREIFGMDKRQGVLAFDRSQSEGPALVFDDAQRLFLTASLKYDYSPAAAQTAAAGLAAALGLPALPPFPAETPFVAATKDVLNPSQVKVLDASIQWAPVINEVNKDFIRFYGQSEVGKLLSDGHFVPRVAFHDPHAKLYVGVRN